MSSESHALNNLSGSRTKPLDMNDVEMIFGTPSSPRGMAPPDDHFITNERNNGIDKHLNNDKAGSDTDTTHSTQPLLEPDEERPKPPLAGPEIDDLDGDHPAVTTPYPGIDDGLLEPNNNNKPDEHHEGEDDLSHGGSHETHPPREDGTGTEDGKWPWPSTDETDYPYGFNGLEPRFGVDDRPGSPINGSIPDVNTYQQKKNLAQGMMDLALLSANANQLRYVLESSTAHPYYYPSLTFIAISIICQVAVGVGLIMNSRYNVKDDKHMCIADKINNMTVLGVFLVTIVNVFITSFSVATPTTVANIGNTIQQAG